ncbi:MAG TPA: hypothetical protein VNH64_07520 [Parvularculaceae bacterium]|nr:hypothetical protein [Parvularculaceae bacterium]
MAEGADKRDGGLEVFREGLGSAAPTGDYAGATPLFNATKTLAKILIVGIICAYALWPERALLSQIVGAAPAPMPPARLTKN